MAAQSAPTGQVLLIDAFSLLFRSFYALPPMNTRAGEPTSGLYGAATVLLKALRERRPSGAAAAFDTPQATFRHDAYLHYKAHRTGAPRPLASQLPRFRQMLEAFRFPVFTAPGFEADDVLATLAREIAHDGHAPLVMSGDRDCLQLARGTASVLFLGRGTSQDKLYDEAAVRERFGVEPHQVPDWIALVGDPSDNLPGVSGVGARGATALLRDFGTVDRALARLDDVRPPRLRAALEKEKDRVGLWVDLARLRDDVPLPPGPRFAPISADSKHDLRRLFEELEFASLLPRLDTAIQ